SNLLVTRIALIVELHIDPPVLVPANWKTSLESEIVLMTGDSCQNEIDVFLGTCFRCDESELRSILRTLCPRPLPTGRDRVVPGLPGGASGLPRTEPNRSD